MTNSGNKSANDMVEMLGPVLGAPVDRFILPNGLTVIHRAVSGGLVAVQLWVRTGSIHEAPYLGSGLSHYLEHMLFKGTAKRSAPEITAQVQAIGGDINAYTTFDRTVYHMEAPSEGFSTAVDILHDMAFNSLLDTKELTMERDVILREIAMNNDDHDRVIVRRLFETAFRTHPFRFPVIGHAEQFRSIDADTIRGYYRSRYTPDNMVLVVIGDVHLEALELALENTFARQPRTQCSAPLVPGEAPQLAPRRMRIADDVSICRGCMSYRVPGIGHPDAPALDMLAGILGGGESAILPQALRMQRQLVHDVDVSCWNPGKAGLLWISYTSDIGTHEKVESAIGEELSKAVDAGFTQEQLDRARRMSLASEIDSRKTVSGHASRLGMSEVVAGDLFFTKQYFDALAHLTPSDVEDAARRYIVPATQTCVTLESEEVSRRTRGNTVRIELPAPEIVTFGNGARVVLQQDHRLPKVHMRYGALGGPLYETEANSGITNLLATLLTRDTQARSAENVSRTIEAAGGRFEEFCGNNSFGFSLEMLSDSIGTGMDLIEYALLKPDFTSETFEIERAAQIARVLENEDDISEHCRMLSRKAFFGRHSYGMLAQGTEAALESLSLRDIAAHYARLVRAGNSVLSICGDFDTSDVLSRFEKILKGLPDLPFERRESPFAGPVRSRRHEVMDREQAVLMSNYPGPGVRSPDYYAAELLDEVLSDMSGPLFVNVREKKGLAYYVGATQMVGAHTGMFSLQCGTHPDHLERVREEFDIVLNDIRENGVQPEALERARTRTKARRRLGMQSIGARSNHALLNVLYGIPMLDSDAYGAILDKIGSSQLRDFVAEYLREDCRVDMSVGPAPSVSAGGSGASARKKMVARA